MSLNKQTGNMYPWVTHTWNPIKGTCPHQCTYCYMKRFPQGELRLDENNFKDNLGEGNFIFVGSSTDIFAEAIPEEWIQKVLEYLEKYPKNRYLLQSKNPKRFQDFPEEYWSENKTLGTTIETNREYETSKAPTTEERYEWLEKVHAKHKMISIEPALDFDVDVMIDWIKVVSPDFVSIGVDSKKNDLPEPTKEKLLSLISELKNITEVRDKENLGRILGNELRTTCIQPQEGLDKIESSSTYEHTHHYSKQPQHTHPELYTTSSLRTTCSYLLQQPYFSLFTTLQSQSFKNIIYATQNIGFSYNRR